MSPPASGNFSKTRTGGGDGIFEKAGGAIPAVESSPTFKSLGHPSISENPIDGCPAFRYSLHDLDLVRAFQVFARSEPKPFLFLGMEPEVIDFGLDLSPALAAALPAYLDAVCGAVTELQSSASLEWLHLHAPRQAAFAESGKIFIIFQQVLNGIRFLVRIDFCGFGDGCFQHTPDLRIFLYQ